jgi:PAS domain S-box-containing protein
MLKMNFRTSEALKQSGIVASAQKTAATGQQMQGEFYLTTSFGKSLWLNARFATFTHEGECFLLCVASDITEQKRTAAALLESEHRYRSLFTNMMQGLIYCRVLFREGKAYDWIYLEANDAFASQIGVKNIAGLRITDRFPNFSETDPEVLEHYGRAASTGQPERFEIYMNASKTWFSISVYSPKPEHIVAILDVITERKQAEAELRKLSQALEQSPVSVVITDPLGNIEYINPKFVDVTGYTRPEVLGKNPRILKTGLNPEKLYRNLWATIKAGHEWHGELCNKKKNGELFWESVSISPIIGTDGAITHFLAVKEDITAHRLLEEEFRQAQKMEAFGRLAAGVAHDFNNLLTVIIGNAGMLNTEDSLDAGQLDALEEITASAERAANLTRQLLMFSRRKAMQPQALQVNDLVDNMGKMLRRLIGEDIALKTRFGAGDTIVLADPGMLEQILMNLAVNSRDAMPEGGELIIETATLNIINPVGHQRPGGFVRLSVKDTGCGIAAPDLAHIFEPFFTTKEVGKGTGLGLATVFGIVEQHNGWIDVESRVGGGTTFHIHLPRHAVTSDTTFITLPNTREEGGAETILLVEDDPSVRALARGILTKYGYQVYEVDSGPAALEIWKQHQTKINLLFTDIVMPGRMSGVQLSEQLLKDKPGLKVVYTSGYTDEMLDEGSALRHTRNFMEKPYSPEILLRTIRSALHA